MLALLFTLWGALAVLYALPATHFSSLTLLITGALMSLPVAVYLRAYPLFLRRTVLEGVTAPNSPLRRWLWHGSLVSMAALISGLVSGVALLSLAPGYQAHHWLALAATALLITLLESPSRCWLVTQASASFLPLFQRRLLTQLALLATVIAVAAWEFWGLEHPDLRAATASELTVQYFEGTFRDFAAPVAGLLAGLSRALDALAMHAAQTYVPGLAHPVLRIGLWLALLIKAALQLTPAILLLSGISALLDVKRQRGWRVLGHTLFARIFMLTLCLLASLVLFAYHQLANSPAPTPRETAPRCEPSAVDLAALEAQRRAQVVQLQQNTHTVIDAQLKRVFTEAEAGIDQFLDWQYSLRGEYTMLLWAATGRFQEQLADQTDALFGAALDAALSEANAAVAAHVDREIRQLPRPDVLRTTARSALDCPPVTASQPTLPVPSTVVAKIPATALATVGGALIVKKAVPKMAGKAMANLVVKFSGAGGALALSSVCGPAMPACAIGLATAFWVVTDLGMIAVDEALTREAMQAELLALLVAQRTEIQALFQNYYDGEIASTVGETFSIPRDGV